MFAAVNITCLSASVHVLTRKYCLRGDMLVAAGTGMNCTRGEDLPWSGEAVDAACCLCSAANCVIAI